MPLPLGRAAFPETPISQLARVAVAAISQIQEMRRRTAEPTTQELGATVAPFAAVSSLASDTATAAHSATVAPGQFHKGHSCEPLCE